MAGVRSGIRVFPEGQSEVKFPSPVSSGARFHVSIPRYIRISGCGTQAVDGLYKRTICSRSKHQLVYIQGQDGTHEIAYYNSLSAFGPAYYIQERSPRRHGVFSIVEHALGIRQKVTWEGHHIGLYVRRLTTEDEGVVLKQKADGERFLDDSGETQNLRVPLIGWEVYTGEWALPGHAPVSDLVPDATTVLPLRQQKLRDALCTGALFAVASLQMTDTATDAYFASLVQRRDNARIFFFAILCILMPLPLKFFLNYASTNSLRNWMPLLVPFNLDGFAHARDVVRTFRGTDWVMEFEDTAEDSYYLLAVCRLIEVLLEALPGGSVQATVLLLDLQMGIEIEWGQIISITAAVLAVAFGLRSYIGGSQVGGYPITSYFGGFILFFFAALDVLLRICTVAIAVSSEIVLPAAVWWAVLTCLPVICDSGGRNVFFSAVSSLALPATVLAPVGILPMFRSFSSLHVLATLLRQMEFVAIGLVGMMDSNPWVTELSVLVVAAWPLSTAALLHVWATVELDSKDTIIFTCLQHVWRCLGLAFNGARVDAALGSACRCLGRLVIQCCCFFWPRCVSSSVGGITPDPLQFQTQLNLDEEWMAKAWELAYRGFELRRMLDFFSLLGTECLMPQFDVKRSTTNDVVREAIIPMSWFGDSDQQSRKSKAAVLASCAKKSLSLEERSEDSTQYDGHAFASVLEDQPVLARRLVSHAWNNTFTNTIAAMVADALDKPTFVDVVDRMNPACLPHLREELDKKGRLSMTYWFCAFSVNQHDNICGGFGKEPPPGTEEFRVFDQKRRNSVTGEPYPVCYCNTKKHFNDTGSICELNKFDVMMKIMRAEWKRSKHDFRLIVAVDPEFELFDRVWCIAELGESRKNCIDIQMKMPSVDVLDSVAMTKLRNIRIENCQATRREDVECILEKIGSQMSIDEFNEFMQDVIFNNQTGALIDFIRSTPNVCLTAEVMQIFGSIARALS